MVDLKDLVLGDLEQLLKEQKGEVEEPEEVESSQAYLLFYEINTNLSSNEIEEYTQQVAKPNRSSDITNIAFV